MSKGSKRRPSFVSNEEYVDNYNRIFKGVESEIPTATQVECTAIVKRSDVWPMSLSQVDLTKMDHPTACKYLVEGVRVKLLCRAEKDEKGWLNSWEENMNNYIGKIYTVKGISIEVGVSFIEIPYIYPAFCLQIIEPGQENNNDS